MHILYTPPETFKIPFKVSKKRYPQLLPSVSVRNIRKNTMLLGPAVKRVFPLKKQGGDIGKIDPYTFSSLQYPPQPHGGPPSKRLPRVLFRYAYMPFWGLLGYFYRIWGVYRGKGGFSHSKPVYTGNTLKKGYFLKKYPFFPLFPP